MAQGLKNFWLMIPLMDLMLISGCTRQSSTFADGEVASLNGEVLRSEAQFERLFRGVQHPLQVQMVSHGSGITLEFQVIHTSLFSSLDQGSHYQRVAIALPENITPKEYVIGKDVSLLYSEGSPMWPDLGCHGFGSGGILEVTSVNELTIVSHIKGSVTFPKKLWDNRLCVDKTIDVSAEFRRKAQKGGGDS